MRKTLSLALGHGVHALAWGLMKTCSPARAHAILVRIGAGLSPIETPDEARSLAHALLGRGTCLSRSLAVAARTPTADLVIGVTSLKNAGIAAHAWIEIDGVPIDPSEVLGVVMARIPGRRSTLRAASPR